MSEYELMEMIFEFEKTSVEYGQYIMAGMFAYIVTIFILGQKMTKAMVMLISGIYTAYVLCLTTGVAFACLRASELSKKLEGSELVSNSVFSGSAEGYAISGMVLSGFWLISYVMSIIFVVLVRKQKFVSPSA